MVVAKAKIVSELAGRSLLVPDLIAKALVANGRIKFSLTLLQTAEGIAFGEKTPVDLEVERALAGLADDPLYAAPKTAARRSNGLLIPGATEIFGRLLGDLGEMRAAVDAGAAGAS